MALRTELAMFWPSTFRTVVRSLQNPSACVLRTRQIPHFAHRTPCVPDHCRGVPVHVVRAAEGRPLRLRQGVQPVSPAVCQHAACGAGLVLRQRPGCLRRHHAPGGQVRRACQLRRARVQHGLRERDLVGDARPVAPLPRRASCAGGRGAARRHPGVAGAPIGPPGHAQRCRCTHGGRWVCRQRPARVARGAGGGRCALPENHRGWQPCCRWFPAAAAFERGSA